MNATTTWGNEQFDLSKYLKPYSTTISRETPQDNSDATEVDESHDEIFEKLLQELQGRKVFLDAAREDTVKLRNFKELLSDKNIEPSSLEPKSDTTAMFKQLEQHLDDCEVIVAFYNQAPYSWLKNRLAQYQIAHIKKVNKQQQVYILTPKQQPEALPAYINWMITDK